MSVQTYYIWEKGKDSEQLLSDNFKAGEFECPCSACKGKEQRISVSLFLQLDAMRWELGHPIRVTSGYRCERHQANLAEIGYPTAKKSQHLLGNAVDLTCAPAHFPKLVEMCEKRFKAIGKGLTWLHVDLRPEQHLWTYST